MTSTATDLAVAAWPDCAPRLLRPSEAGTEDYAEYTRAGGYRPLIDADALLTQVDLSGLLGRGGAAFPIGTKLRAVHNAHQRGSETVVVANGEEGEPASVKDRWLLRNRPHLVLDGLRLATAVAGARRAYVYVSDSPAANAVTAALSEVPPETFGATEIAVVTVEPGYVAGEETAAVRRINGGPAKPTDKPPRPFEEGVAGVPTMVSNIETLANLPYIHEHGAEKFRSVGTPMSPGTFLATITGGGRPAALYEIPHGASFADLLHLHGVTNDAVTGVLMGGYFAGLVNTDILDATLDHESVRRLGSGLGCGAISILTDDCPVAVAAAVMSYFDRENAGQCGSCFNGTAAMAAVTSALRDGVATQDDVTRLERWSVVLRGRGACGTLDGATNVAASLLRQFPQVVARHLADDCTACRTDAFAAVRPYEVEAVAQS
ncbi:NADH:ubiquinone oxidoreductase, NADH-binding (51 kD) subunit [Mycolicibacterium flavescens]|uniref:NADH-ubiquinone oxidoreductase-F iron-sulfur binding region domain-containing protein n=1 Tax=Mycobacterium TaxID=1763 RepID=UPI00080088D4|nr:MULTISPECIES: NADH-ubiquinone oxidoreductase-F iron-sulfur binding region domain-containing protein [Mycobacterium]OBF92041.1 NADH dehydrogenase [Mycobacterium sp. 852002-51152_SCH6134967]VEG39745.1 NADH:ubiquinone oxidoreductase, NADH-binding (51 kD) subunit [Mycolicibacterium flavescens]